MNEKELIKLLKRYNFMKQSINFLEIELQQLDEDFTLKSYSRDTCSSSTNKHTDMVANYVEAKILKESSLKRTIREYRYIINVIDNLKTALEDSELEIIELLYIQRKSYFELEDEGYGCYRTVRAIAAAALDKMISITSLPEITHLRYTRK